MAALSLTVPTDGKVNITTAVEIVIGVAGEAVTAVDPCRYDATGAFIRAKADVAGNARVTGIATKTVVKGQALTLLVKGILDGVNLSTMAYGDSVYLGTTGGLDTAAGTVPTIIGSVWAGHAQPIGAAPSKVLHVER